MTIAVRNWKRTTMGFMGALALAAGQAAHAGPKPTPLPVGQTAKMTLDRNQSRDYSVSLGKGKYRIVWDAERVDGRDSNIMGVIKLLKPNGVVIESNLLGFNAIDVTSREGTVYNSLKPFVARFRVMNTDAPINSWFTVVPMKAEKRVPFGWGEKITPARISADNGVGGTLKPNETIYHSITLPKGKWSVSLGLELPDGQNSNLMGSVDLLDTYGFTKTTRLVNMNEISTQARAEGVVTIATPTPVLLRVKNSDGTKTYTYDVTISKAD